MTETKSIQAGERTHKITLAKGGTAEREIALESLIIPDLSRVNYSTEFGADKVIEVWHLAHDLKRELIVALDQLQSADATLAVEIAVTGPHDYNKGPVFCTVHNKAEELLIGNSGELLRAAKNAVGCFGNDEEWWTGEAETACPQNISSEQVRAGVIWELQEAIAKAEGNG